jgi:predicted metal-dependent hydrolase
MLVRKVELDFSDAKIRWAEDQPEFCHLLNATSSFLHHLESFLNKAVRQSRKEFDAAAHPALDTDVSMFCAQEGWHAKLHAQYNTKLVESGYPWIGPAADNMRDDFSRFLATKSPRWCLAYSEGFETVGPIVSQFFFEEAGDVLYDWDEPTVYLWLWHFAEEYEHRSVCNHLFKEVYDNNYPARIYGTLYALCHQFSYTLRTANALINADLAAGRIKESKLRSKLRFANMMRRFFVYLVPKVLFRTMRPSYDPAGIPPPKNSLKFLAQAEQRYAIRRPSEFADGPAG